MTKNEQQQRERGLNVRLLASNGKTRQKKNKDAVRKLAARFSPPLMDRSVRKQGRLYFQAGDEEELQRWMPPLRAMVKFYDFQNDKRA